MHLRIVRGFKIRHAAVAGCAAITTFVLYALGVGILGIRFPFSTSCSLDTAAYASTKQTGTISVQQDNPRPSVPDSYGGSFYKAGMPAASIKPLSSDPDPLRVPYDSKVRQAQSPNLYGNSFYSGWNSPMHLYTTHIGIGPGISGLGGPGFSGSSGIGTPASIRPNGIGAAGGRSIPMITPVGNGANAPMGMYGGSSFGSSAGGAVR
jgi:hypothetical protein